MDGLSYAVAFALSELGWGGLPLRWDLVTLGHNCNLHLLGLLGDTFQTRLCTVSADPFDGGMTALGYQHDCRDIMLLRYMGSPPP